VATAALATEALLPSPAAAHGLAQRADLPIPPWLIGWAAAVVLVASFVALAALWPRPKLERDRWRPLRGPLPRAATSRPVEVLAGLLGVLCLAVAVWAGLVGMQNPLSNIAPTLVYAVFWVGLVPLSVLFGDVFRALNPWRAVARATGWLAGRVAQSALPEPQPYPRWLGRWPAAVGLVAFAWLELVYADGDQPRTVAVAALLYSAVTWTAMALFGSERWTERGEAFSVYFNFFSRLSPLEVRHRRLGVRPPLSGLAALDAQPGTVALVAVMLGITTFDGASAGPIWVDVAPSLVNALRAIGIAPTPAFVLVDTAGLLAAIVLVAAFYRLALRGASGLERSLTTDRLTSAFAHTLVPIAVVYVGAHYLSFLIFQGQALGYLLSDPLGHDWNLLGTATWAINYGVLGATAIWWLQVALVVAGHVTGLALAHDRALVLYRNPRLAVRSQYWLLTVMVGFTGLALALLSQANA
jgi:hypothetical protein